MSMDDWRKTLLQPDATLREAIRSLDASGAQIAMVIDGSGRLIGTLTDGDIRRGLLRGLSLDSSVEPAVHREPMVVPPQCARDVVLTLMRANRVHQLPVVDDDRQVVGLHLFDELMQPGQRPNSMVIMAGGKGTRLRPLTENCPKPLLPVRGKPMLEHIIERARSVGFHRFTLAVHYLGEMIVDYFGNGSRWGVEIEYLHETSPLGTAGALSLFGKPPTDAIVVTNGDVITDINYGELLDFHLLHQGMATMAVRQYEWQHPFGVVQIDGVDIVGFEEKPIVRSYVNAGIYVLDPRALRHLPAGRYCDMPTLFARLKDAAARTIVYPMHEPWLDVGRPDDLERVQQSPHEAQDGSDDGSQQGREE